MARFTELCKAAANLDIHPGDADKTINLPSNIKRTADFSRSSHDCIRAILANGEIADPAGISPYTTYMGDTQERVELMLKVSQNT
jgi:hypothetical protein